MAFIGEDLIKELADVKAWNQLTGQNLENNIKIMVEDSDTNLTNEMKKNHERVQFEQEGIKTNEKIPQPDLESRKAKWQIIRTIELENKINKLLTEATDNPALKEEVLNLSEIKSLRLEANKNLLEMGIKVKPSSRAMVRIVNHIREQRIYNNTFGGIVTNMYNRFKNYIKVNPVMFLYLVVNVLITSVMGSIGIYNLITENTSTDLSKGKPTFTNIKDKIRTGTLLNEKFS